MTNSKQTKRALFSSAVALLLCFTMLLSTTFAWFTDSAASGSNVITAGNLDIDVQYTLGDKDTEGDFVWNKLDGAEDLFQKGLWEPGHTEVVALKITNAGSLALKYNANMNIVKENKGMTKDGADIVLSDILTVDSIVMDTGVIGDVLVGTAFTDEDTLQYTNTAKFKDAKVLSSDEMLLAGASKYVVVKVDMAETVGNEANHDGTNVPSIEFGINVLAAQFTHENDSFGNQYDKDVEYPWDGTVPATMPDSLVVDGDTQTIHVNDAAAFAYLSTLSDKWAELYTDGNGTTHTNYVNGAGGDYYFSGMWTVSLEADIDLNNQLISPVLIEIGETTGASRFDGNGHTIKNAMIVTDSSTQNEAGLFATSRCDFKNLKLDNINVTGSNVQNSTAGVLAGSNNNSIENITITNSSVTGGKYTGGVIGYGYTDITNCTLTNVTVKGGYKLGGLIGYICASSDAGDVTGNRLTDCTVDGIGDGVYAGGKDKYIIGKLVGNYNCDGTCNNNTITNMTTSATANIGEIEAGKTVTQ